jgi:hypothetical protein
MCFHLHVEKYRMAVKPTTYIRTQFAQLQGVLFYSQQSPLKGGNFISHSLPNKTTGMIRYPHVKE